MAKQRPEQAEKPKSKPKPTSGEAGGWSFGARLLVSLLVTWHLFAVFISPFAAFTDPRVSPLLFNLASSEPVRLYAEPMYVAGGYQFFSPDPPRAGMLVRYTVTDEAGATVSQGEFPNRTDDDYANQWPRLWYHRHMMLADQVAEAVAYRDANGIPLREENLRLTLRSYARHLLRKHGGSLAKIDYIEHRSLPYEDVWPERVTPEGQEPRPPLEPTDPRLYSVILSVTESASQLEQPLLPPAPVAAPESLPLGIPGGGL